MAAQTAIAKSIRSRSSDRTDREQQGKQHREQLRRQREEIITILMDPLPTLIQVLFAIGILSQSEVDRLHAKRRHKQKAGLLLDILIQASTSKLMVFVDVLRKDYPQACTLLEPSEAEENHHVRPLNNDEAVKALTDCLNDTQHGGFYFLHVLRTLTRKAVDFTVVSFEHGFGLMHEIVRRDLPLLLQFISHAGLWRQLYNLSVESTAGPFARLTPLELAVRLKKTKCKDVLTEINSSEDSLTEVERCVRNGALLEFLELKAAYLSQLGSRSLDEKSLLELACQSGDLSMLQAIITMEQNLPQKRMSVSRALAVCVDNGFPYLLQLLLDYIPTDLASVVVDGRALIERAAISGDVASFTMLEQLGAPIRDTVVTLAAAQNRLPLLQELFTSRRHGDTGININFQDKRGKTPAQFAAEKGYVEVCQLLLDSGFDMTLTDKRGYSVMHAAAGGGSLPTLEVVIEAATRQGCLVELLMGCDRYVGAERCFLVRGRDQDHAAWHYVETDRGLIDIFQLRTAGGSVDVAHYGQVLKSGWGVHPSPQVVEEIENKYDALHATTDAPSDMQPLHVALIKRHEDVALRLITAMKDVTQEDCFGLTPLHLAAMRGYTRVIQALMDKGVRLSVKDAKGRTPAELARANDHPDAISALTDNTSVTNTKDLRRILLNVHDLLSTDSLKQHTMNGQNPKPYIKSILRNLVADINDYMFDHLDVGPISVESCGRE